MMAFVIGIFIFIVLAILTYAVIAFNSLVRLRNNITKAQSNIDVLIKQRFDEVPRLVEICKGYIKHEALVLGEITNLRATFDQTDSLEEKNELDQMLTDKMGELSTLVENYPQLKAVEQFLYLQKRLSTIEMDIADRREFYNESVNIFNSSIEAFPTLLVAKPLGFKKEYKMFEV